MVNVVKFETPNCQPCKIVQAMLDKVADKLKDKAVKFEVVDATQQPERAKSLGITKAPTVVVFNDGTEVARFIGAFVKQEDILAVVEPLV